MKGPLLVATALATTLYAAPSIAGYQYKTVDYPGAQGTMILAINDLGHYVGLFQDAAGTHAMYFDGRHLGPLDAQGVVGKAPKSRAYSINNLDQIAGSYSDAQGGLHGFIYCHGKVTTLDYPGKQPTEAYGINDLEQVIGVYYGAAGDTHGFVLENGAYQASDLPGSFSTTPLSINDLGEVVGLVQNVSSEPIGHGYVKRLDGTITTYDAPGAPAASSYLVSINNLGQTLGGYVDAAGTTHNFLLTGGKLAPVDIQAGASVTAQTINDLGQIVGYFPDAAGVNHGFIAVPDGK